MRIDRLLTEQNISAGQNINIAGISDIYGRLNIGDIIHAQVVDFTANELMLMLSDGTSFTAATMPSQDVKRGDFLDLRVKDKANGKIFLERLAANVDDKHIDPAVEAKTHLESLGIKADESSVGIAVELKEAGIPPSRENLNKVLDLIKSSGDLSLSNSDIGSADVKGIGNANTEDIGNVDVKNTVSADAKDIGNSDVKNIGSEDVKNIGKANAKDTVNADANNLRMSSPDIKKAVFLFINGMTADEKNITALKQLVDGRFKVGKGLEELFQLIEQINDAAVIENIESKLSQNNSRAQVESPASDILPDIAGPDDAHIKFHSIKLREVFESMFVKVDESIRESGLNTREVQKQTLYKLSLIKESIEGTAISNRAEILEKIDNIENNIRFMNEIKSFSYVQLPLIIGDSRTTGEIFILERERKKRKQDQDNVTMFISLNTANLGRIDSLISFRRKNVCANMKVESQEIINYIKENIRELYEAFSAKGYKLADMKYGLIKEDAANIIDIKRSVNKELVRGRRSIDYRL